jgi:hypothetical protein
MCELLDFVDLHEDHAVLAFARLVERVTSIVLEESLDLPRVSWFKLNVQL